MSGEEGGTTREPLRSGRMSEEFARLLGKFGASSALLRRVADVADERHRPPGQLRVESTDHPRASAGEGPAGAPPQRAMLLSAAPVFAEEAGLSQRQQRILSFIREWVDRHGYPPTIREIGAAVGLLSPSSVAHQLKTLERGGFLRRSSSQEARSISEAIRAERPFVLAIIGEARSGKSATVNALFGELEFLASEATTVRTAAGLEADATRLWLPDGEILLFEPSGLVDNAQGGGAFYDVLVLSDVVLWVHSASSLVTSSRTVELLRLFGLFSHEFLSRVVLGLNRVDEAEPRDWNARTNLPSADQQATIARQEQELESLVRRMIPGWKPKIVPYSAARQYNISALFLGMIEAAAPARQWLLGRVAPAADFRTAVGHTLGIAEGEGATPG